MPWQGYLCSRINSSMPALRSFPDTNRFRLKKLFIPVQVGKMQEDIETINRRTFLKLGASGLAAADSASFLPRLVAEQAGKREAPARPVMLRSSSLEVSLDGTDGLPFEYRLLKFGIRF